jgi:hypothetical protein
MSTREREGLISRIRQIRRSAAAERRLAPTPVPPDDDRIRALEGRIMHLERLVEGLQDSVDRESERHRKLIADLEARIQPAALGKALNAHARERGL